MCLKFSKQSSSCRGKRGPKTKRRRNWESRKCTKRLSPRRRGRRKASKNPIQLMLGLPGRNNFINLFDFHTN